MIEYCYKLNLPDIEQVVLSLDNIKNLVPKNFKGSKIFYPDPSDIFKTEWLSYKNISWDYVSLFIRSGKEQSVLHRDNPYSPTTLHWGINWIYGDNSIMEFWEEDKIEHQDLILDSGGRTTMKLSTNLPSSKKYMMTAGAYLVNASVPHKITNLSDDRRIALSLRSKKFRQENPSVTWNKIIDMFRDVI